MTFFSKSPTRQRGIVHGEAHVDRLVYEEFVIEADSNVAVIFPGICFRTLGKNTHKSSVKGLE